MDSNVYNGVRAEPKFLRDPTSLESISSGISRLSSYVTSNLPKRKSLSSPFDPSHHPYLTAQQQQQQAAAVAAAIQAAAAAQQASTAANGGEEISLAEDEITTGGGGETTEEGMDTVTFTSFDKLEYKTNSRKRPESISCLLLGYHDGFQIWDITNPDNVHELCSIRDKELFGTVSFIHIIKPSSSSSSSTREEPLLAIVSETTATTTTTTSNNTTSLPTDIPHKQHKRMDSNTSSSTTSSMNNTNATAKKNSHILIYSLQSQSIIKEINDFTSNDDSSVEDDTTVVTCIKSNHKVIVLGCLSRHKSSIHLLSTIDFKPFSSPLTDIYHDTTTGPIFNLGSRFIAYATNTAVLNSDPVMTSLTNKSISYTGFGVLQGEKDVKGAAKDIAKEVVSGMKTLGEFGLNTLSNYFGKDHHHQTSQQPSPGVTTTVEYGSSPNRRTSSPRQPSDLYNSTNSNTAGSSGGTNKKMVPSGMIMIRDILKLPTTPTRNLSVSTIAHFRPHTHPVTCLTFNQAGTLLMSASKQGHTFHIFSILTSGTGTNAASHVYSLSRGITDAQVEDCQFSIDSTWCAITTARGTTHVYAINPYGGKPEIAGHVHGKVNNPAFHPLISNKASSSSGGGIGSGSKAKATTLNSVVRIKQRRKMPGAPSSQQQQQQQQDEFAKYNTTYGYYGPTPPHYIPTMPLPPTATVSGTSSVMQNSSRNTITNREPRAKITAMFVTPTKSPYLVNNSNIFMNKGTSTTAGATTTTTATTTSTALSSESSTTPSSPMNYGGSIKQQASNMLSSFGSSMSHLPYLPQTTKTSNTKWSSQGGGQDKSDTLMFGFDEEYDDSTKMMNDEIGYQDLYSFHPDGILTLHRCWVGKTVVKKRENGRNIEKLDLSLKEEDVAEWKVARNADWDQVKLPLSPALGGTSPAPASTEESTTEEGLGSAPSSPPLQSRKKNAATTKKQQPKQPELPSTPLYKPPAINKKLWLSNAEITTYASHTGNELWTHHQFSFQTYKEKNGSELRKILSSGLIPSTDTMIMLKGMPEPVSSRLDRIKNTNARIANDKAEDNMEVALAELEDSISKAMQTTSFTPSSTSMSSNSPAKWLSSSAKSANNLLFPSPSPGTKSFLNKNSSVSFEDAYLIHMGSGPSPEPPTPLQLSSLIQFDNSDDDLLGSTSTNTQGKDKQEDIMKFEDEEEDDEQEEEERGGKKVYSPDGDNEVDQPSDSMFGDFRTTHHQREVVEEEDDDPW